MQILQTGLTKLREDQLSIPSKIAHIKQGLEHPDSITPEMAQSLWNDDDIKVFRNTISAEHIQQEWASYEALVAQSTYSYRKGSLGPIVLPNEWHIDLSANEIGEQLAISNELVLGHLFRLRYSNQPDTDYEIAYAQIIEFGLLHNCFGSSLPDWVKVNPRLGYMLRAIRTAAVAAFGLPNVLSHFNNSSQQGLTADQLRNSFTLTFRRSINPILKENFVFLDELKNHITVMGPNNSYMLNPEIFIAHGSGEDYYLGIKTEVMAQIYSNVEKAGQLAITTGCPFMAGKATVGGISRTLPVLLESGFRRQLDQCHYWEKAVVNSIGIEMP